MGKRNKVRFAPDEQVQEIKKRFAVSETDARQIRQWQQDSRTLNRLISQSVQASMPNASAMTHRLFRQAIDKMLDSESLLRNNRPERGSNA